MVSTTAPIAAVLGFIAESCLHTFHHHTGSWGTGAVFHFRYDMCCHETWPPRFPVLAILLTKGDFCSTLGPSFPQGARGTAALARTSVFSLTSRSLGPGLWVSGRPLSAVWRGQNREETAAHAK